MTDRPIAKRLLLLGMMSCAVTWSVGALAQDAVAQFPTRNITLIVPFGAGGPPDSIARVVAAGLSQNLGKPVIVENRPGASTALAANAVARAPADGYTLMAVDISFAVTPHIASNLGVDPFKDFKPVGLSAKSVFTLLAAPALHTPTMADFLKAAKAKGEDIKIGHTGVGTTPHLAAVTFIKATGIAPLLVPYRTVAEATNNVIAGHISAVFSAASTAIGLASENKVSTKTTVSPGSTSMTGGISSCQRLSRASGSDASGSKRSISITCVLGTVQLESQSYKSNFGR